MCLSNEYFQNVEIKQHIEDLENSEEIKLDLSFFLAFRKRRLKFLSMVEILFATTNVEEMCLMQRAVRSLRRILQRGSLKI